MKTNYLEDFKRNNTERISWITLMNRNGYFLTAVFFATFIVAIIVNQSKWHLNAWEFTLAMFPVIGGFACLIWFGFYQYWKQFNKSYGWKIHTIMKGKHYSSFFRLPWIFKARQSRIFMFAPECAQATNDDINKLYRIGFGIMPWRWNNTHTFKPAHQWESIGFGWRGNGVGVEIFTYTYLNGIRQVKLIAIVPVGVPFIYDLTNINHFVLYSIIPLGNEGYAPVDYRSTHDWPKKNYGLNCGFYFGGDAPADQNYQVWEKC